MELIDRLKELYDQVDDKKVFHQAVADEFELKASSVRTNWFGSRFEVPEKYGIRQRLVDFTETYVNAQKQAAHE